MASSQQVIPGDVGGLDAPRDLRVGLLSLTDPSNPQAMAGMPYRMAESLRPRVAKLVTFSPEGGTGLSRPPIQPRQWPGIGRLIRHVQWRWLTFDGSIRRLEHYYPDYTRRRTLRVAQKLSNWLLHEVRRHDLDVLLGCIASWPLYAETTLPLVFYTDATTTMVNSSYPRFADRCAGFKQACTAIEDSVYSRASAIAVSADAVLSSAIHDHHLPAAKGHVVPMGANIQPASPLASTDHLSVPTRDALHLVIIASDPTRKRLDFAIGVADRLNQMGWRCKLTSIGPGTDLARRSSVVEHLGPLQWSSPAERPRLEAALSDSHFFILPSTAEGAAIAPAEAAHFGRPSIVSDIAGLPTVVRDGETGRVLPLSASVDHYAEAIVDMARDSEHYRAMSEAALKRAQQVFTWDAWADRMVRLLAAAVEARQ